MELDNKCDKCSEPARRMLAQGGKKTQWLCHKHADEISEQILGRVKNG